MLNATADPDTIHILSTDAPKLGVRACAEMFLAKTGTGFDIDLATAPEVRKRVIAGDAWADIVIAPLTTLEELAALGRVDAQTVAPIGAVSVGVVVRDGAPEPDLSSVETFTDAVLAAGQVVYNRASSGIYVAEMMAKLGLSERIAGKTIIVPTGAAVMEHLLAHAPLNAIGFGHVTEIRLHDDHGTHLVGVLPAAIGRNTVYACALSSRAGTHVAAPDLLATMTSPAGKRAFEAVGVL